MIHIDVYGTFEQFKCVSCSCGFMPEELQTTSCLSGKVQMVFIFLYCNRLYFLIVKNLRKFCRREDYISYVLSEKQKL